MIRSLALASAVMALSTAVASSAGAATMVATYYTLAPGDPDTGGSFCCGTFNNEVLATLGPDGRPVYNPAYGGPALSDVNSNGELTWWSPTGSPGGGNANVTMTGGGPVTIPINFANFYPPNGTGANDANGFQTAIFRGVLHVPTSETVSFNLASDDDAFLALNNTIIDQVGGVHGVTGAPVVTSLLAPGNYLLTLFYADRDQTQAQLQFGVDTVGVNLTSGVPEPASWSMMLIGVGAMGSFLRLRRKQDPTALRA